MHVDPLTMDRDDSDPGLGDCAACGVALTDEDDVATRSGPVGPEEIHETCPAPPRMTLRRASVYEQHSGFRAYVEATWETSDGVEHSDWSETWLPTYAEAWEWAVSWEPAISEEEGTP